MIILGRRLAFCWVSFAVILGLGLAFHVKAQNPIVNGWYADPEIRIFEGQYWIYPTYSDDDGSQNADRNFSPSQIQHRSQPYVYAPFLKQTFFDIFSSPDLVHWTKHADAVDIARISWAAYALWAPSTIEANGKFYMFFGANDIKDDTQIGGIGEVVSDQPGGPYSDALGQPLIGQIHNGAQPIDPMVFRDDDGQYYLYYGGWGHCNVVKLS